MKTERMLAMAVIWLVISLPIVSAQTLNIVQFGGQDEAKGYIRPGEPLNVEVEAAIPGEAIIDPQQIKITKDFGFAFFDNCFESGGSYTCTFTDTTPIPGDFVIELRTDDTKFIEDAAPAANENLTLTVDALPPSITKFIVSPEVSTDGSTVIVLEAEDYAEISGDTSSCSGLKNIEVTVAGDVAVSQQKNLGECTTKISQAISTDKTGQLQVCARATDYMNRQSVQNCKTLIVDKDVPVIRNLELRASDGGMIMTHTKPGDTIRVNVHAEVEGDPRNRGDDIVSVQADLTQLNPNYGTRHYDSSIGTTYSWNNILVTQPQQCQVKITAEDATGNTATQTFPCTINLDEIGPTFVRAFGPGTRDAKPLVGPGGQLSVVFDDKDNNGNAGIGFQKKEAYLDMSSAAMGARRQANECTQSGSEWTCTWEVQNVPTGEYTASVHPDTQDDLGNRISTTADITFNVDTSGPQVNKLLMKEILGGAFTGIAVQGNSVHYEWNVSGADTAEMDATGIGHTTPVAGQCVPSGDTQTCIFDAEILISGPYDTTLNFNFRDDANNTATSQDTLTVYNVTDDTSPSYWTIGKPECTPSPIDRRMASLIDLKVYCRLPMSSGARTDATPISVASGDILSCTGDVQGYFSDDPYVINDVDSTDPILVLTLQRTNFDVNNLTVQCPLTIYTKVGDSIIPTPEQETAEVTIDFYNLPEGDLYTTLENRIDKESKDALDDLDWVGQMNKIIEYGRTICNLKDVWSSIVAAFHIPGIILDFFQTAASKSPDPISQSSAAMANTAKRQFCQQSETIRDKYYQGGQLRQQMNRWCALVQCQVDEGYASMKGGSKYYRAASFLGGGAPWCKSGKFMKFMDKMKIPGYEPAIAAASGGTVSGIPEINEINVKDSLILSGACLCLPAFVNNMERLREIKCKYAYCLAQETKEYGLDPASCRAERSYQMCAYVVGEAFSLWSITQFYNKIAGIIRNGLKDPMEATRAVLGTYCYTTCPIEGTPAYAVCSGTKVASVLAEAVGSAYTTYKNRDDLKSLQPRLGYCNQLEEVMG